MTLGVALTKLEDIHEDFIKEYELGNFTEGICNWNGDDALMSPYTFGKKFSEYCDRLGYKKEEYDSYKHDLMEWCEEHLRHLESKFR